jgi:spermidine synthase
VMLTTYLLALALGSFLYARVLSRSRNPLRVLALVETLIGVFALLSLWAFSRLGNTTDYLYRRLGNGWHALLVARYAGSFLVMFIPTLLIGVTFPLVNRMYAGSPHTLGRSVGTTYAVNTVGCILGSFVAGFVLIPAMGITKSIVLVGLLNAALGAALAVFGLQRTQRDIRTFAVNSAALVAVSVLAATSSGIILQRVNRGDTLLYYHEGSSSTVAVVRNDEGYNDLLVNGIYEVPTDYGALRTFHMLGALPLLLHHDPQNALVLCFGAGITTGSVAQHGLARIDAVELSPEVIAANPYFAAENQAVLGDPSVHLTENDGRNYLLQTIARYDVIISDATHPDSGDSWVLYTREFYELCRSRLNPRGIMTQWLPLHALAPIDYKTILKTFQSVFPQTTLWFTNEHTVMVGATDTFTIDVERLAGRLQDPDVKKDLAPFFFDEVDAILASFILGPRSIADYTRGAAINTDNHPFVLSSEMRSRVNTISLNLMELSGATESISPFLTKAPPGPFETYRGALTHLLRAQSFYYQGLPHEQMNEYRKALAIKPGDDNITQLLGIAESRRR